MSTRQRARAKVMVRVSVQLSSTASWFLVFTSLFGLASPIPARSNQHAQGTLHTDPTGTCLVSGGPELNFASLDQAQLDKLLASSAALTELAEASISHCVISRSLNSAHLEGTTFSEVNASGISFENAHLDHALFSMVSLRGSSFRHASLRDVRFEGQGNDLTEVTFDGADLSGSRFEDSSLGQSTFWGANLKDVVFDVRELPDVLSLASAEHIETLRSPLRQVGLHKLAQTLADYGLGREARAVGFAAEESIQARLYEQCMTGYDYNGFRKLPRAQRLNYCVLFASRSAAFDFTCRFGMAQWRPLLMIGLVICLTSLFNFVFLLVRPFSPLFLAIPSPDRERRRTLSFAELIRLSRTSSSPTMRRLRLMKTIAVIAVRFSIQNAFVMPAKDIDIGKWLQMVWGREITFSANGGLRTIAGVETLLCFGLLVLWILEVFSRFFTS